MPPPYTIAIEKGFMFTVGNSDWLRPFTVAKRIERSGRRYVLCIFNDRKTHVVGENAFTGFGAVLDRETGIIETWPLIERVDKAGIVESGDRREVALIDRCNDCLHRYICPKCSKLVVFKETRRQVAEEVIEVTYICPKCGHREIDVID